MNKPIQKPHRPYFGSGPTVKNPSWQLQDLQTALYGRSHRSIEGKQRLAQLIDDSRTLLQIPPSYQLGIIPGSATGAMECLLWSLLGARPVDTIVIDVFSALWQQDIISQLKLPKTQCFQSDFGQIPDLSGLNPDNDWVFGWNGTTSGLCFDNGDWIPKTRQGLTLCDATSAAFACNLPWEKLDAVAFSWQKALGGEAGQGMIVLSPRAVERLETYTPPWPLPRLFRLTKDQKLNPGIFKGETINTPSLLCVEDCLLALQWAHDKGGLAALIEQRQENFAILATWVAGNPWIDFVVKEPRYRSQTSVCLALTPTHQSPTEERQLLQEMARTLREENAGFDFVNHAFAPPSLRIWTGPTVDPQDLRNFLPWVTWAYFSVLNR
jgi:phosphoserine aminotransferase